MISGRSPIGTTLQGPLTSEPNKSKPQVLDPTMRPKFAGLAKEDTPDGMEIHFRMQKMIDPFADRLRGSIQQDFGN